MRTIKKLHKNNQSGFTVVELFLIFLVILVLGGLMYSAYSGVREKERNAARENNLSLIKDGLELYYAENYRYPSLDQINDSSWRATNLKKFDSTLLIDPSSSQEVLSSKPAPHEYAYLVTTPTGAACDNKTKICTQYTLVATLEGGGTYTKSSLN
jgi:Tfp pilus assembly protein PilE